ncbi:MAG TPA: zinc ribbon domain-containing protein [Terriglobales bacterium]|nr:zinc ribbon domain-containing protein [Terriglobales bacterium]
MPESIHEAHQEFWRPPSAMMADEGVARAAIPAMAEACPSCGTEFLPGSRFCHSCGRRRPEAISGTARADAAAIAGLWRKAVARVRSVMPEISLTKIWRSIKVPAWPHSLTFPGIKGWLGLPPASLIAFSIGLSCVAGAMLVGLLTAKTLVDWQAIQFYRVEWLLAAVASFVAGILLKKPSGS